MKSRASYLRLRELTQVIGSTTKAPSIGCSSSFAQSLGFSLQEIRKLLLIEDGEPGRCSHVRHLIVAKVEQVKEKIAGLRRIESHLAKAQEQCSTALKRSCSAQCSILQELESGPERIKVKVEVLYFKGCPKLEPAVEQVGNALRNEGVRSGDNRSSDGAEGWLS